MVDEVDLLRQVNPEIVPSAIRQRSMDTVRQKFLGLARSTRLTQNNEGAKNPADWQMLTLPLHDEGALKLSYVTTWGNQEMLTFPAVEFNLRDTNGNQLEAKFVLLAKDAPQPEAIPRGFSTLESLPLVQLKALADLDLGKVIDLEKLQEGVNFHQETFKKGKDQGFFTDNLERVLQRELKTSRLKLQIAQALTEVKGVGHATSKAVRGTETQP